MLLNFCDPSLKPLIKCDKVSFDDHEVTNLVSSNPTLRQRGFISDHFIKPPVNITLQFPCNIVIYRIVINPVVGQQKSCDMKVFTAAQVMTNSWLYGKEETSVKSDGLLFSYVGNISQNEPTVVCFENTLFRRKDLNAGDERQFPCRTTLHGRKQGSLTNVSHLTVCIQRSPGGKSAAIRSLEVWGVPAGKVPHGIQSKLRVAYSKAQLLHETTKSISKLEDARNETTGDSDAQIVRAHINIGDTMVQNGIEIPEDFVDQITYDIMALPVLLPSGKNIDQLTLDKFTNAEASWGRGPGDPFTGVTFTQKSHPVVNTSLKARIDKFVMEHSDVLTVPRTLGHSDKNARSKTGSHRLLSSRLLLSQSATINSLDDTSFIKAECGKFDNVNIPCSGPGSKVDPMALTHTLISGSIKDKVSFQTVSIFNTDNRTLLGKRKMHCSNIANVKDTKVRKTAHQTCTRGVTKTVTCVLPDLTKIDDRDSWLNSTKEPEKVVKSHSVDLAQSLDSALSSALIGLPSFSRKSKISRHSSKIVTQSNDMASCCKCKLSLESSDVVKYKLPCQHLICRNCLKVAGSNILCSSCDQSCKSSQVIRIF